MLFHVFSRRIQLLQCVSLVRVHWVQFFVIMIVSLEEKFQGEVYVREGGHRTEDFVKKTWKNLQNNNLNICYMKKHTDRSQLYFLYLSTQRFILSKTNPYSMLFIVTLGPTYIPRPTGDHTGLLLLLLFFPILKQPLSPLNGQQNFL